MPRKRAPNKQSKETSTATQRANRVPKTPSLYGGMLWLGAPILIATVAILFGSAFWAQPKGSSTGGGSRSSGDGVAPAQHRGIFRLKPVREATDVSLTAAEEAALGAFRKAIEAEDVIRGKVADQYAELSEIVDEKMVAVVGRMIRTSADIDGGIQAVPSVIRSSALVSLWPASQRWRRSDYLERRPIEKGGGQQGGQIHNVYRNTHSHFGPYFDRSRPLAQVSRQSDELRTHNYQTDHTATMAQLLEAPKEGEYLYLSTEIENLGQWALDDVYPYTALLDTHIHPSIKTQYGDHVDAGHGQTLEQLATDVPAPLSSINVWIGQKGVVAHCHYDGYHNYYAQLNGTKTFLLLPPSSWNTVGVYPFIHPSHAQCIANLSSSEDVASSFPSTSRNVDRNARTVALAHQEGYVATLEPGDLLYLPPLWFHHVIAETASVSVNFWTDSAQTASATRLFELIPEMLTAALEAERLMHSHTTTNASDDVSTPRSLVALGAQITTILEATLPQSRSTSMQMSTEAAVAGIRSAAMIHATLGSCALRNPVFSNIQHYIGIILENKFARPVDTPENVYNKTHLALFDLDTLDALQGTIKPWTKELVHIMAPLPTRKMSSSHDVFQQACRLVHDLPWATRPLWLGNWVEAAVLQALGKSKTLNVNQQVRLVRDALRVAHAALE